MSRAAVKKGGALAARAVAVLMSTVLAVSVCVPSQALAIGEDAGAWTVTYSRYHIEDGYSAVNGGAGYHSDRGEIGYCYDYNSHGPGTEGQEYTHMKRGTTMTDYIMAMGYPATTTIGGKTWSDGKAQAITQLAAWLASGTVDEETSISFENSSDEVVAAAHKLYNESKSYKGGDASIDGCSSIIFVDGSTEVQPMLTVNLFGHISLTKLSAVPDTTDGNALYPLSGAKYGIYTDAACAESYHGYVLTTDKAHNADLDLVPGTYYVKEIAVPDCGAYTPDATVYKVKVEARKTTPVNGGKVTDTPQSNAIGIFAKKHDSDTQAGRPQGDAVLKGAVFTVKYYDNTDANTSGAPTRTWQFTTDDHGEIWLNGGAGKYHSGGDPLYKNTAGKPTFPFGTYAIQETSAPQGYLVNSETHVRVVKDTDGKKGTAENVESYVVADSLKCDEGGIPVTDDDVIRGGVQVVKADRELDRSEAIGGNHHDEKTGGTTLSGIEFTIVNESAMSVKVGEEWFEPGQAIETITTAWNEEAQAYTAQTPTDELPYGTYTIQETKTNESYLLTDGEPRTFQIREDGLVVKADADGESLTFRNQVVRNDIEVTKKASSTNESLMVPFLVTNVTTGEAHVFCTDRNGDYSSASSWNKHSSNTNGNDGLIGAEGIKASDMDPKAGLWFSLGEDGSDAPVDDTLAALPYGEYLLQELRCEANQGLELVSKTFWIERDSGAAKAVWMSIDDEDGPRIGTTATDAADGDHYADAAQKVKLVDTVAYERLKPGTEYVVSGTLMVKSSGEALLDAEGNPVTGTTTFTPVASSGTVDIVFELDASLLAGEDVVAFESVRGESVEVAAHCDIDDEGQTVRIVRIGTTLTDDADGDHTVEAGKVKLTDTVEFEGLEPGVEYTMAGTLMDKETGKALVGTDGKEVTATARFTPDEADGTVEVTFEFDTSRIADGGELVAFERCLDTGSKVVASHEDIDDEGQTVKVHNPQAPEGPKGGGYDKTGDATLPIAAAIAILAAGAMGAAAYGIRKRRDDGADEAGEE